MPVNGVALAAAGAGVVLLWSAVENQKVLTAVQDILLGKKPPAGPQGAALEDESGLTAAGGTEAGGGSVISGGSSQAILQQTAAQFGWTGAQWQALQNVEMAEAGFNPLSDNPGSGAYGLAQALGHGTSGTACPATGKNEYGGYGLSTAQAQQANCGQPGPQALWMCNYIKDTYGNPENAWAHEQSEHWY